MTVTVVRHEEQQQGISWSVTTSLHHNINEVEYASPAHSTLPRRSMVNKESVFKNFSDSVQEILYWHHVHNKKSKYFRERTNKTQPTSPQVTIQQTHPL